MTSLFENLALTCRRIVLEDLRLDMHIGAYASEHGRTQPVRVSLEVWIPLGASTPRGDNLEEVYDYTALCAIVEDTAARGHIRLQETFANLVLDRVMADPRVRAARIRTAKEEACAGARAVAVETFRFRPEHS